MCVCVFLKLNIHISTHPHIPLHIPMHIHTHTHTYLLCFEPTGIYVQTGRGAVRIFGLYTGKACEKSIYGHINDKRAPSRPFWEAKLVRA